MFQLGGSHENLTKHIEAVKDNGLFGAEIDFKLAKSSGPESYLAIKESHFDTLQITICKVKFLYEHQSVQTGHDLLGRC